jgi:hypothetical protein
MSVFLGEVKNYQNEKDSNGIIFRQISPEYEINVYNNDMKYF